MNYAPGWIRLASPISKLMNKSKIRFLEQIETTKHYIAFCIETYFINPSILVGAMPIQGKLMNCEGDLSSFKWKTLHKINTSLLMLREWTYTASSRDALGNTSPRPSRFPSGGDFAPLGPRDCPRASPSGNLSGLGVQNPRPWEISWASGDVFPNTSLLSAVYGYIILTMTLTSNITSLPD